MHQVYFFLLVIHCCFDCTVLSWLLFLFENGTLLIHWTSAVPYISLFMVDIYRAMSSSSLTPCRTAPWTTMTSDNTIYEQLYDFKFHCHMFREILNCINSSGIWGPIRHSPLKITNSLAILRMRKPLKTSTMLAGHGIWTRDLPNASLVRYHLARFFFLFAQFKQNFYGMFPLTLGLYWRTKIHKR